MPNLPGPRGAIPYERDAWGYPTIHARDEAEAAWARGWLHATDRGFQAEVTRIVGEGRLMELVGDQPFARRVDRSTRALGFAHGLDAAVARMDPALRAWMQAYADGFSAGAEARGTPWPLRLAGFGGRRWTVRDVLLAHRVLAWFGLTSTTQLAKAVVAELAAEGASADALRALLGPGADGFDPDAARAVDWDTDDALLGVPVLGGSNAFAVAGHRSASGAALVLAEFHLEIGRLPPVLYAVDVRYDDGGYVLGVTFPGLPHVLAGRNPRVAWSYTFGHADNIDITIERVVDGRVVVGDRTEPVSERVERVRIARGPLRAPAEETWRFRDLPSGAALLGRGDGDHPAMRWWGLEDPVADHEVLRGCLDAGSVEELVALHRRTRTLSAGAVFGDADGHVAWMHTGVVPAQRAGWGPRRRGPDEDVLPETARPVVLDPPEGVVGAANEHAPGWTAFPEPPYRKQRLLARLAERPVWDLASAERVTVDEHDPCAERLLAAWADLLPDEPDARRLVAWAAAQHRADVATGRALRRRFHRMHHEATRGLLHHLFGGPAADRVLDGLGLLLAFQSSLDDVLAGERSDLVAPAVLADVVGRAFLASRKPGPSAALERARFVHVLDEGGRTPAFLGLSSPPVELPGGPTSLFQTRRVDFLGHSLVGGPAFRLVMDLGVPGARYVMAGGASERPFGPGYGKGIDAWVEGRHAHIGPRGFTGEGAGPATSR